MNEKILVVDDEKDLVDLVCYNLEKAGLKTLRAYDGESALRKLTEGPHAVILDVMLPLMDGWEVLKRMRQDPRHAKLPVIMLTARGEESDKVLGLELGADDYLAKPFSPRELVARVRALLRRAKPSSQAGVSSTPIMRFEGLEIDASAHEVKVKHKPVVLTAKEFQLLSYLAARPGRVVNREVLLQELWQMDSEVETRTVDVHMRRLRQKLGTAARYLSTVRGVGYKFVMGDKA